MEIVVPSSQTHIDWKQQIEQMLSETPLPAFSDVVIDFLDAFSKKILLNRTMRSYPEFMATAHWFRRGHVMELKRQYDGYVKGRYLRPRGTVLHFAPANVDSIFMYSWILSLLVGNKNIVRLSSRQSEQLGVLLEAIDKLLERPEFVEIKRRCLLLRYGHEVEYTQFLSERCQVRVIWGGDASVQRIRQVPLAPNAVEMVFPNRYSKCVLSAEGVIQLPEERLTDLTKQFYNDAFWFAQMACSSPREVFWVGELEQVKIAQKKFWNGIENFVKREGYQNPLAVEISRMTTAAYYATKDFTGQVHSTSLHSPVRVQVSGSPNESQQLRAVHCGGGLFIEQRLKHVEQIVRYLSDEDQTLTYYGFDKSAFEGLIQQLPGRAIDRIVPVGQALQFNTVWDGYSFFLYFTREVILG